MALKKGKTASKPVKPKKNANAAPAAKRKAGRPSIWTTELEDRVVDLIAHDHSVKQIGGIVGLPDEATIQRRIAANPDFAAKCARAREMQADHVIGENAELERQVLSGKVPPDAARVVISSRQWRAMKLAPKKYSDKVVQEHVGADGGPIQTVTKMTLAPLE